MNRTVALSALLVLGGAGVLWITMTRERHEPPASQPQPPRPSKAKTSPPSPRHREAPPAAAPAPADPVAPAVPAPAPAPSEERRLLNGRTAAEILAPFADVARRAGRERFRDDMVAGGAWTQLCEVVDEDYERAVEAFTRGDLATAEKGGVVLSADARRRYEESEKAYWRVIADLQQRTAALYDKIRDRAYLDDAERDKMELRRSQMIGVTDELNRARIKEQAEILKTATR